MFTVSERKNHLQNFDQQKDMNLTKLLKDHFDECIENRLKMGKTRSRKIVGGYRSNPVMDPKLSSSLVPMPIRDTQKAGREAETLSLKDMMKEISTNLGGGLYH